MACSTACSASFVERAAGRRFLVNSLMEAIRSSQLGGATTSRVVAKEMLRSGREPTDRSERMILKGTLGDRRLPDAYSSRASHGWPRSTGWRRNQSTFRHRPSSYPSEYWLAEYLPISRLIRNAPAQHGRVFLEAETDEGDTTYFLIHRLSVIERAIGDLHDYLQRKTAEIQNIEGLLHGADYLNGRQLTLLTDAVRDPDAALLFRQPRHESPRFA